MQFKLPPKIIFNSLNVNTGFAKKPYLKQRLTYTQPISCQLIYSHAMAFRHYGSKSFLPCDQKLKHKDVEVDYKNE